jgi:hypothetical protein
MRLLLLLLFTGCTSALEPPPVFEPADPAQPAPTDSATVAPTTAPDCQAACEAKVAECQGSDAASFCAIEICPLVTSADQVSCLEAASCFALADYLEFGDPICGLVDSSTPPPSGGGGQGAPCDCGATGDPDSGVFGFCQRTGECGFSLTNPLPGCLYDTGSRTGTCILGVCTEDDEFQRGPCDAGQDCRNSGARRSNGSFWYTCGTN